MSRKANQTRTAITELIRFIPLLLSIRPGGRPRAKSLCVKKCDPTISRIYVDLFDDKALTSVKDCLTHSNILSPLHGLILGPRARA
jgi:hypothetical protein